MITEASTEKHGPPALPNKKPSLPPPVGKKPTKPDPPRPVSMHENKTTESDHSDVKSMSQSMVDNLSSSHSRSGDKKAGEGLKLHVS